MLLDISGNKVAAGFSLGLELYALVVMVALASTCVRVLGRSQGSRYLRSVIVLIAACLAFDALSWAFDGQVFATATTILWVSTSLHYITQILVTASWMRYAYFRAEGRDLSQKSFVLLCVCPVVAIIVLTALNTVTGWVFTYDRGIYLRGPLSFLFALVAGAYVFGVSAWLLYRRKSVRTYERRSEFMVLACSALPALVATVFQGLFYGLALIWPSVALTMLAVCISRAQSAISRDAFTGLNNRGTLDHFLVSHVLDAPQTPFVLILFDIDQFKAINDANGHTAGDWALQKFAEGMRSCFDVQGAFLSRYGGDEFAAVIPNQTPEQLRPLITRFQQYLRESGASASSAISLTTSVGMATMPNERVKSAVDLIRLADENMYADKRS